MHALFLCAIQCSGNNLTLGEFPTHKKQLTVVAVNVESTLPTTTRSWFRHGGKSARCVLSFSRIATARMDKDNNNIQNVKFYLSH